MHYFRKKQSLALLLLIFKMFKSNSYFLFLLMVYKIITINGLLMMSVGIKSIFKWQ